jgi:hypothetical protein
MKNGITWRPPAARGRRTPPGSVGASPYQLRRRFMPWSDRSGYRAQFAPACAVGCQLAQALTIRKDGEDEKGE